MRDRRRATAAAVALIAPSVAALVANAAVGGLLDTLVVIALPYVLVGALLTLRRPDNVIGWLLVMVGFLATTGPTATNVAVGIVRSGGPVGPAVVLLAWYAEWYWVPMLFLALVVLPLVLPSGRAPAAWMLRFGAVVAVVATGSAMFQRDLLTQEVDVPLRNPVGFLPYGDADLSAAVPALLGGILALGAYALLSLLRRYRRSRGIERRQLTVVLLGAVMNVLGFFAVNGLGLVDVPLPLWLDGAVFSLLPVAILIAVTRYRLYEIDRFVTRTVTYGAVTAVLIGVYVLIAVVPSALLSFESDLLVAAATLAAAGVFVPVRQRVQAVVDRRFNRDRYDAARVIDQFAHRLRRNVDLDSLAGDLHHTVAATVQPAAVSLWLRRRETGAMAQNGGDVSQRPVRNDSRTPLWSDGREEVDR